MHSAADCPVKLERFVPINEQHSQLLRQALLLRRGSSHAQASIPTADTAAARVRSAPFREQADTDAYLLQLHDAVQLWKKPADADVSILCGAQLKLRDHAERVEQLLHERKQGGAVATLSAKEIALAYAEQAQRVRDNGNSGGGSGSGGGLAAAAQAPCAFYTRAHMAVLAAPVETQTNGLETYHVQVGPQSADVAIVKGRWLPIGSPEYKYYWDPLNNLDQWHIDGLTVDPHNFLCDLKMIGQKGVAFDIVENALLNKSVGQLPKIMVYIAVHAQFGTSILSQDRCSWWSEDHGHV